MHNNNPTEPVCGSDDQRCDTTLQHAVLVSEEPRDTSATEVSQQAKSERETSTSTPVFDGVPHHLHPLVHKINTLSEIDILHIAAITEHVVTRDVYTPLLHKGSSWFLPEILDVEKGTQHPIVSCGKRGTVVVAVCGRLLVFPMLRMGICALVLLLVWFTLWSVLPHTMVTPGGCIWDPVVLVLVSTVAGGFLSRFMQIPPLVGVLWVAIAWNNIPYEGYLTSGIGLQLKDISSKMGLSVIMARAGFSMTISGLHSQWKHTLLLAVIPFALEATSHSLIANAVFHYNNYDWAFLQGSICSIVSPSVVVPGVLYLQNMGYGRGSGPLSLMLSSVGIEIAVGVWMSSIFLERIFLERGTVASVLLGPAQLIGGTFVGIGVGIVFFYLVELYKSEWRRLPNGKMHVKCFLSALNFAVFVFLNIIVLLVFLGYGLNLAGGGCTACISFASTVTHMCIRQHNAELEEQKQYMGGRLALLWDNFMMPVLFSMMGAKIDVKSVFNSDFLPKALICLFSSTAVRMITIFMVQTGSGLSLREKLLVCLGYCGKASAQASLGPIAAFIVAAEIAALPAGQAPTEQQLEIQHFAKNIQQMSAFYVMTMAALASVGLMQGGMALLRRPAHQAGGNSARVSEHGERKE
uniref:Uncharacterized protein TCIL3000_5_2370 n=1 Tax=Trypanosoma congolense (strain IL3000) TaxID=1068625 RepID=G0UMW9_TRYCI|nr:unnamed protein product [Trypanosoma congolense IL3000]